MLRNAFAASALCACALLVACGGETPPPQPCPSLPPPPPPPVVAAAPSVECPAPPAPPPAPPPASASASAPPAPVEAPPTLTKATGGPRGTRACAFHESVDSYPRSCVVKVETDGTLSVTAKGTALNPNNGFSFRMGGGPDTFDAVGKLDAFGVCKGPFVAKVATVLEGKSKTYELRFRDHCKIVIR